MSRRRRRRRNQRDREETVLIQGTEVPKSQARKVVWVALAFGGAAFLLIITCMAVAL